MTPRRVRILVLFLILALVLGLVATLVATFPAGARPQGEWIAGDLHVHTCHSHDVFCLPDDPIDPGRLHTTGFTVEQRFAQAAERGLDYLAITDHNDISSQDDPGFGTHGVIGVRGYEKSLDGHAQMLGAPRLYDPGDRSTEAVLAARDALHTDGGVFQVNHPAEGSVDFPDDADWAYGYEVRPDTVEVWNISRLWQPPMPVGQSNDDAIRYWEGWLDRGERVAATGGSDSHWMTTSAVQGVGQPTTWVFVTERSERGVLEGLRRGRTFISHQPPAYGGPRIFLEAGGRGDGAFTSMVGDTVPPRSTVRVRVKGAPATFLRVVADHGVLADIPVASASFAHELVAPPRTRWIRAEVYLPDLAAERRAACDGALRGQTTYCRNALLVLAMTSALFVAPGHGPPGDS